MFEEAGFQVDVQEVTYEDPSHKWTHTINFYCTWYLETAWLAAIQGGSELFMFSFFVLRVWHIIFNACHNELWHSTFYTSMLYM